MATTINKSQIDNYVGFVCEPTPWHTVTQEQINQFADCTLDHQFIHVDPQRAAETPFGSTIAHGFLTLSMLSHFAESFSLMLEGIVMGVNSGFDKVRFLAPVKVGKRIRAHSTIVSIEETKPNQFRFQIDLSVEIEGEEKPALVAEWISIQVVS